MKPLKSLALAAGLAASFTAGSLPALAKTPADTIVTVAEEGPNSLDTHGIDANDGVRMIAWNVYDRLLSHGTKVLENGLTSYDKTVLKPELATSWTVSPDGKVLTFKLREDAVFHDGTPVTAEDVKWSFDRAVSVGGFPKIQMGAGGFTDPSQFRAVDAHTFEITLVAPNKLALPDLTVPIPIVINSKLAKSHATADDPWALKWLQRNDAGGGAFKVDRWEPGSELVLSRFDKWKSGPLPAMKRVLFREVASAGTRRALLERGDVDISAGLPPKDFAELSKSGKFTVTGVPIQSALLGLDLNVTKKPFDNPKVREAIAYALPYDDILKTGLFGRGIGMYGAEPGAPYAPTWPVPSPYKTDLGKAKALLTEAGYPDGFSSEISFNLGQATIREPVALLIQDALGKIGVKLTVNKVPSANWFAKMASKEMPMVISDFYAWLDWPDYNFFWTYDGKNASVFNTAAYGNPQLDGLIEAALKEDGGPSYEKNVAGMIDIVMKDVPRIPILRWYYDIALQKNVGGYVYWFHTHVDYRALTKS